MEKITSRRNPLAVHIKKLGASRSYREENREFLCDGIKLLEEADKSGAEITTVITAAHLPFPLSLNTRVLYADRFLINSLSPLKNAQDLLFICNIPKRSAAFEDTGTHILLDGVQDPGNVGTVIRTANAFGIKSVILTGGCADLYNPKTVRASMGSIFKQNVFNMKLPELIDLKNNGVRFIGSAPGMDCLHVSKTSLKDSIIAIGSEGGGLSDELAALCGEMIKIPIAPECESLNAAVAAAIIMWESSGRGERDFIS